MFMKKIKVLVACEESQTSCIAFRDLGCEAFSCDLQPCSGGHPEWHIQGDALSLLSERVNFITEDGSYHFIDKWDLLMAHPPCTYLSSVTAPLIFSKSTGFNKSRFKLMKEAASFFMKFYDANIDHICVENPRPLTAACLPLPGCKVSPDMFGSKYSKRTYLWLRNLPPILATCDVPNSISFVYTRSGSKARSKSDPLMYRAIAKQFIDFINYERS